MSNDWSKLILGDDDSQTAPICNGQVRDMIDEIESLERQRDVLLDAGKYLIETMNEGDGLGEAIDMIEAAIKSVEESHE